MLRNDRGSTSVFLVFILAAMLMLVVAFIYATADKAAMSVGDSLCNMSGRAVLAEFDRDLKDDYGIFAFDGHKGQIEGKIRKYLEYSVSENKHVKLGAIQAFIGEYALININVLQKQITEHMKYALAEGLLDKWLMKGKPVSDVNVPEQNTRCLRNEALIADLPSKAYGYGKSGLMDSLAALKDNFHNIKDLIKKGRNKTLINEYIISYFNHMKKTKGKKETFFTNEVEYIIAGSYSDNENRKKIRDMIIALRTAVNIGTIYSDKKMRLEVAALAETITPGAVAVITQAVIAAAWARAEASNDFALLEHGRTVPAVKTKKTWAVDLESAWKNKACGYIDTGVNNGQDYEAYLKFLLYFRKNDVKLARVLDLIQINMKGRYNRSFFIREHNCGFKFNANINGRKYVYEEMY